MKRFRFISVPFLALFILSQTVFATTYTIDPDHSSATFKIRHLLSNVQGNFKTFEGVVDYEPGKPETWKTTATIQANSIDTNVAKRDEHLKGPEFFDVEKFSTITFVSTRAEQVDETHAKLNGLLTIHGVEKPVTLDLEIHGIAKDPWGNTRAAFTGTTQVNRKDFGLAWNKAVETGQLLVGEEVQITLEIESILQV